MALTPAQIPTLKAAIAAALCALAFGASAQSLSNAQITTLRADILSDPALAAKCVPFGDGTYEIAAAYSLAASPQFIVWKTAVPRNEVGKAFVATALDAITAGNNDKLANFAAWNDTINPSRADQRAFFDQIFSVAAGASTRAALLALWKRDAKRIEKLYATGAGSDASPATMVYEGSLSQPDALRACNQ
jgi:hypothetical protein